MSKINKDGWAWRAPEYFSRWRVFPRLFISVYIYIVYYSAEWFMALQDPSNAQAGFVSVIVGAGAGWFAAYVNSGNTKTTDVTINNTTDNEPKG